MTPTNLTQSDTFDRNLIDLGMTYVVQVVQRNTTENAKARFLAVWGRMYGMNVAEATRCAKISRDTYYRWIKDDPEFKEKVESIEISRHGYVEDMLLKKIKEGDGASIRFYLSKRHPKYMPVSIQPKPQVQCFEDWYDEEVARNNEEENKTLL